MHSTLTPKPSDDPHDMLVVAPDAVRVAPAEDEISSLLRAAARHYSDPQLEQESGSKSGARPAPPVLAVDTTFRPAAVSDVLGSGRRRSIGRRLARGLIALLLAGCLGGAAMAWQTIGFAGKKVMAKWVPQFALTSSVPWEKLGFGATSSPPADEPAEANTVSSQDTPPAPAAAESAGPPAATADSAQQLQSMARDLANVSQEVELLKAGIAELKANQQQLARDAAKASGQNASDPNARAKLSMAVPRPPVVRPRKPPPPPLLPAPATLRPAAAQPAAPYVPPPPAATAPAADPELSTVPRPPMPVSAPMR